MTHTNQNDALTRLCDAVMHAVADFSAKSGRKVEDYAQASEVMKGEIKALLFGDEYKNERECLALGTVHQGYIIQSVVASCILKIKWTTPAT